MHDVNWDAVSGIAAAGGVLLAAFLGIWAVRVAQRTVQRAELEYLASRADDVLNAAAEFTAHVGEYKAALHVFWKEHPKDVNKFWTDPETAETRRQWLTEARAANEVRAHEVDYLLGGSASRLRAHLSALGLSKNAEASTQRMLALIDLAVASCRLQYATLVPDHPHFTRDSVSALVEKFSGYLLGEPEADTDVALHDEVRQWLLCEIGARLESDEGQETPEIVAIDFHERFIDPAWDAELTALTGRAYKIAHPAGY